jgi:undecaprenyl diphosphate synthase
MLDRLKGWIRPGTIEEELVRKVDFSRIPRHVAVIMDGNGRWAKARNLPRVEGHRAGAKAVEEIVESCGRMGVAVLTLFAFSRENWKRPEGEVRTLWKLLEEYLKKQDKVLIKNKFRLMVIGQREGLPAAIRRDLERVEALTRDNCRLTVVFALNYGGRAEIVDAAKRILAERPAGSSDLDEEAFSRYLYTAGLPDPDLLIRTSGEYRISNFVLWQIAYAEIWITKVYWPDFRKKDFLEALLDYQKRERRFGDIHPPEEPRRE